MTTARKHKLVFEGSSGRLILDELMRICTDITGIPFGHMGKKYIGAASPQIRVYVGVTSPLAAHHHPLHIWVRPGDITEESWEDITIYNLKTELARALLTSSEKNDNTTNDTTNKTNEIISRIQAYPSKIASEYEYIAKQQRKHAHDEPVVYNKYVDRCLYEIKVIFDK